MVDNGVGEAQHRAIRQIWWRGWNAI